MNRLSPVSTRFPACISLSMKPPPWVEPSPKIVCISMPASLYIIEPASAMALSPGSSSTSTNCISEPITL